MTKFEWITRAQMHFANRTKDYTYDWINYAETCYDNMLAEDLFVGYSPEECVDEELSYWGD